MMKEHMMQEKCLVIGVCVVVLVMLVGLAGCNWFDRKKADSPTGPVGSAEQMANWGGPSLLGQYCLTVNGGGFTVNFPQGGGYKLHYGVASGWSGDLILQLSQAATFGVGLNSGDVLRDVRVQAVLVQEGVKGDDMGAGVTRYFGPGDPGSWTDVATVDSHQAEVVLMEGGQLRVIPCPVVCPPCECPSGAGGTCNPNDLPVFVNNGDGTVTDTRTGLMWLQDANCIQSQYPAFDADGLVTQPTALTFVNGINAGTYPNCGAGYTDWHLPTVKELQSMIDYSNWNPALPGSHPFTNVQNDRYWSSTDYAPVTTNAWDVYLYHGLVLAGSKTAVTHYVWPVR